MLNEIALIQTCVLPEEAAQVEIDLPDFMKATRAGFAMVFSVYAATHQSFLAGIDAALDAGLEVLGVVDYTMESGPSQAKAWQPLLAKHGHDWVRFGSSPAGKGFINHEKVLLANAPSSKSGAPMAPADSVTAFANWRDATAAGLGATWGGSWNITRVADRQVNDVSIIVSQIRCAYYAQQTRAHFAWITQNEPQWQGAARAIAAGDMASYESIRTASLRAK